MRIVIKKKKIRVKNKDIKIRNKLRDDIYNQRRIIQSVIFQYKIEVILTYLHLFYYYILLFIYFIYIGFQKN